MEESSLQAIQELLSSSQALVILAGAGMSADSGIPTYRGENGTWGRIEKELNRNVVDIMTPQFIQENPLYMWKRFSQGYEHLKKVKPHRGYFILRKLIQFFELPSFVLTSNVDRLFVKAGFREDQVFEVHGAGGFLQCTVPCWEEVWQSDYSIYHRARNLQLAHLPKCPNCGSLLRPNVHIFRDKHFVNSRIRKQKQRYQAFLDHHRQDSILVIEIGSGPTIKTIRNHTQKLRRDYRGRVIRINPYDSEIVAPHLSLATKALEALIQ
ncbi:MAG: Sir2 family NAD-dependent protein deacetylase, partial [Bacteroidota bacterium]